MKAYKTTMHIDKDTVNVVHHSTKIIEHSFVSFPKPSESVCNSVKYFKVVI